uniref:Uncharacterized protein n=1 Tax=Callithrix jacchus TaxID=9483 RepID=A0A8I3W8Q9_CALJA
MCRKLNSTHLSQFSGKFFSLCLFELGNASHRLGTQDTASPVTADLIVSVIVIGPDNFRQLSESAFVFQVNCVKATVVQVFRWTRRPSFAVRDSHFMTQGRCSSASPPKASPCSPAF